MPGSGLGSCGAGACAAVAVLALVDPVVRAASLVVVRVDSEALGVRDAIAAALNES